MKITPLLIGACLLFIMTGCHKPSDVIGAAEAAIKTTALTSITAKYPDVGSSELKFSQLTIRTKPDGTEAIYVIYSLPASATTSTEGKKATTTTKTISVSMSQSGKVESVSESTQQDIYNVTQ
jgi:hypothetical protein